MQNTLSFSGIHKYNGTHHCIKYIYKLLLVTGNSRCFVHLLTLLPLWSNMSFITFDGMSGVPEWSFSEKIC